MMVWISFKLGVVESVVLKAPWFFIFCDILIPQRLYHRMFLITLLSWRWTVCVETKKRSGFCNYSLNFPHFRCANFFNCECNMSPLLMPLFTCIRNYISIKHIHHTNYMTVQPQWIHFEHFISVSPLNPLAWI